MARRKKGSAPTEEEIAGKIREKAYELYEKGDRSQGRDLENWLEAERIVKRMTEA